VPGLQKCDSDACRCERAATAASGNSEALCDAVLGNAATNDADRASALRARAQIRSQAHRYDGAITDADEAIGIDMKIDDPFDAALAYDVRGNAHLQRNEDAAAFADFDSAVNEMPHDTRFGVARGLAYLAAGNLAKAARDFGDVIDSSQYPTSRVGSITMTLYDNHADAYWGRGVVRLLAVHYDEAAEDFTKTIALDPKSGIAAIWLHYVRERQGHDDSAELAANAAKLDPAGRAAAALKLFAGNAPAATANDVASGPESANGTCEGILAVAEWNKFSRHDDANAARAYRAVVGTCQRSVQTALAQAMLQTPPQVNLPR
jgi:tetratricopeptide (TPR) repeat protein